MSAEARERRIFVTVAPNATLQADLTLPEGAFALVVFAHGGGSGRFSPRNRFVADALQQAGLATVLVDLLTVDEEEQERFRRSLRFDVGLLSKRLIELTRWLADDDDTRALPIGYFGASTGAAAALAAAALAPARIGAIVSRGGRPDLAGDALAAVRAPTLLIVGGADWDVIRLNLAAVDALRCEKRLEIVPGATHLFEEPGALGQVAALAREWFVDHLLPKHPAEAAGAV
jgi:putative phosphoribosyl transferase